MKGKGINKEEYKQRFSINTLITTIIFGILLLTALSTALFGFILLQTGVISHVSVMTPFRVLLMMMINSVVIGTIITAVTSRITMKPLDTVMSQLRRLASGDFKARLDFGDRPLAKLGSVKELTECFNTTAQELENTEMLRSDFVNNFSHEFKTPIVSIAGFAKLLKHGNLSQQQMAEYIDIIEEESLRLAAMATNVLNMTKVENQNILIDITSFNLSEQIRSNILMLEEKWMSKNIDFDLNFGEHMIMGNEDLLKHVWSNLIDNAIKYSPEFGTVEVSVREDEETFSVSVLNAGSEIPLEKQKRIFDKFYQADESRASEGHGIGLALVKRITELHSGTVSVQSEQNTTVFTVVLPKKQEVR